MLYYSSASQILADSGTHLLKLKHAFSIPVYFRELCTRCGSIATTDLHKFRSWAHTLSSSYALTLLPCAVQCTTTNNDRITVPRWSSGSHVAFSFACLFVLLSLLLSDFKRFVAKSESHGNLSANSIRTSRDRIQFYDKKHNNIENNFAKTSKWNFAWRPSWNCGYVVSF